MWFGNRRAQVGGAGFGGDSAAPVFRSFMSQALAGQPENQLPDQGPVCARSGGFVNPDGGRNNSVPVVPVAPAAPQLPTVQQVPTAPTTPADHAGHPRSDHAHRPRSQSGRRPVSELDVLLTLQEHDSTLERLLHRHHTLPERDALREAEGTGIALDGRLAAARAERDRVAREEQQLDDEARSLADEGQGGRVADVLG